MTSHGKNCTCCQCRPTPDQEARFNRPDRFDKTEHGTIGRSVAPEIDHNELGPSCHLDSASNKSRMGETLGAASESVKAAGASIASGARAPRVDWGPLRRIRRGGRA